MIFLVQNPFTGERFECETEAAANNKIAEIKANILVKESYRFGMAKEIASGNDTTWMNADLNNDPENGVYQVFNTFTGQHEKVQSLSAAKARHAALQTEFLGTLNIGPVIQTPPIAQPISKGVQTL
jgi:hypothetical protein